MEFLKCSSPTNLKMLSLNSPFTSQFPIKALEKRNRIKYNNSNNKGLPFSIYLPLTNKRNLLVCSHFGRKTPRRNSLRKKLTETNKNRVSHVPSDITHSIPNLDDRQVKLDENVGNDSAEDINSSFKEPNSKPIGESVSFNKLESWVEQYKRDTEFWGIGSGPIFTVFESADRKIERVSVNKEEILRRCRVEGGGLENSEKANLKVLEADNLVRELESGKSVIPRNSSVAKFVVHGEESSFWNVIRGFSLSPKVVKEFPRVGIMLLYGFVAVWALRKLFDSGDTEVKLTESEKEIMRRKIRSRKQREVLEKDGIEVVQEPLEPPLFPGKKPKLDTQELMKDITRAKRVAGNLALPGSSTPKAAKSMEFDVKIQEIRKMAREARDIESAENGFVKSDEVENQGSSSEAYQRTEGEDEKKEAARFRTHLLDGCREQSNDDNDNGTGFLLDEGIEGNENVALHEETSGVGLITVEDLNSNHSVTHLSDDNATSGELCVSRESSVRVKPRIIRSVKEAREYLSENSHKYEGKEDPRLESDSGSKVNRHSDKQYDDDKQQESDMEKKLFASSISGGTLDSLPATSASEVSALEDDELVSTASEKPKVHQEREDSIQRQDIALDHESDDENSEIEPSAEEEKWNENNVDEQIAKKIGVGFRDNYLAAREKKNQAGAAISSMTDLRSIGDINELDWMEDDHLAEIVFKVRENELAGLDPFHKMDAKDKDAFFKGLEKKVERENEKLSVLHEWLHSNIENLDYGADGISVYDPPEKIIPRWKGPVLEKSPEFLNNFQEQRKAIFAENTGLLQKSTESLSDESIATSSAVNDPKKKSRTSKASSKTVIESSDGSVKAGKKSGKEFWQHTKKWSRGFVESYNAETDPEVKSTMRDIGKDLDRWITEKEIQEAADFMDKLPERNKEFMEKKLSKLKREMELFGPQAVVSKYREYANDHQEDYLWWLDLPHILCIELYTVEDGEQRIGFYSLEMATDLELEPKPHHVIAFQDAGDCKNLCYIIQAQMETLGNGLAYVVAQPPKDAFREAKENGFNVTVIRKGELELNVDQTLEEVEEQIAEIGSKMYHDMIMRDRSVDISSLMKGVFGFKSRPTRAKRKRSKKLLKKRGKK